MKTHKRRIWRTLCCAGLALMAAGVAFLIFGTREAESLTLSAGLQHLADRSYVAASTSGQGEITLDAAFFDRTLQGGSVTGITVTSLPDVTAGELKLGYGEVHVGQYIDRDNLAYFSYIPADGAKNASFSFLPETKSGACGYTVCCQLNVTDGVNCCPTGTGSVTAVSTHATLSLAGTLTAEDPEGDALFFEVVSYPAHGTLSLDSATGQFSYLPTGDFSGEDAFLWRVQDANGGFSAPCEVKITVRELATGYLFSDVTDSRMHSAALLVSEKGLMSGEKMGGKHYFHPEKTLSRAAFVAILLEAAGVECKDAEDTGYTDNADIPRGMRGAIKHAREQGWLGEDTVFRPHDAVTRAEAASIAAKVLGLSAPGYKDAVKDHAGIPVSVVDALYAAYEGGYIGTMADGSIAHAAALSRGEAALFFARVCEAKA